MKPAFDEKRDLQLKNPYQIVKSGKYETFCVQGYYLEPGGGGGYLTKITCNTGRLRPEVQPLSLLYTILAEKVTLLYTFY